MPPDIEYLRGSHTCKVNTEVKAGLFELPGNLYGRWLEPCCLVWPTIYDTLPIITSKYQQCNNKTLKSRHHRAEHWSWTNNKLLIISSRKHFVVLETDSDKSWILVCKVLVFILVTSFFQVAPCATFHHVKDL